MMHALCLSSQRKRWATNEYRGYTSEYGDIMSWIPTKDELPPDHVPVLVCWRGGSGEVFASVVSKRGNGQVMWYKGVGGWYNKAPTHWMYMPDHVDKEK